jgi:hypothetical protein
MSLSCPAWSGLPVKLHAGQAEFARGAEHALGLGQRERDALAEHVDRVDQPFGGQHGQHLAADQVDVVAAAAFVLGRQRVRAEERRAHGHAEGAREPARHPQLLALVLERQAVAGLDLDGADALGQQRRQA